ncbi:hypothetical protein RPMA_10850 [Tardiphaga alba]|uniref:Uncharacterized protein n=1 Tax=Tardiphaga alba TaxID=340268 RepID=A0ABX8A6H9_9BRAD|nr:hypothetical protein [Tardiphaga alba]QUS39279.1 hypothetical protein RPMA_10850 [Tardiphaga alba]
MARKSKVRTVQKPARAVAACDVRTRKTATSETARQKRGDLKSTADTEQKRKVAVGVKRSQRVRAAKPAAISCGAESPDLSVLKGDIAVPVAVASLPKRKHLASRLQLINRLADVIARRLDAIDGITAGAGCNMADGERQARTIAMLVRVLNELKKEQGGDKRGPDYNADRPRDLDELRERLSHRLAERIDGRSTLPVVDHAGGGDPVSG